MKVFGTKSYSQAYILMEFEKSGVITASEFGKYDGAGAPAFITVPEGKEEAARAVLSTTRWPHTIEG